MRKKRKLRDIFDKSVLEESYGSMGFESLSNARNIKNHLAAAKRYTDGIIASQDMSDEDGSSDFEKISNDIADLLQKLRDAEERLMDDSNPMANLI